MANVADATPPVFAAGSRRGVRALLGADCPWLAVMVVVTTIEFAYWTVTWMLELAPAPFVLTYIILAFAGLACALALRAVLQPRAPRPHWWSIIPATILVGVGASLFLPLKYAIPRLVPFWLDAPLARLERLVFTVPPWLLVDRMIGWLIVPMDRLYGLWLPTQALLLFIVMVQPSSPAKSRALIAYVLAWFLLGVVAAVALSSAGPIFYDRIFGGTTFAALRATLQHRGAWVVLAESDKMWMSLASNRPSIVAGISAVPSVHVAICVWIVLVARILSPRFSPFALTYAVLIWIGSVQLGWHYVTDGLAGTLGMLGIWAISRHLERYLSASMIDGDEVSRLPSG